ncbi:hypothetical protein OG871_39360 [Kitasatospora sp. NBC_00374]|uniref:hypothetical protein n=1 Tax=Kitasatospora sp. NBC_00374 TaxID=2975964 RepID=UPI0030E4DC5B
MFARAYDHRVAKKQKTFELPTGLKDAQRVLAAARAERAAFLATLPVWRGDLEVTAVGVGEELRTELGRLEEAERRAAHVV